MPDDIDLESLFQIAAEDMLPPGGTCVPCLVSAPPRVR